MKNVSILSMLALCLLFSCKDPITVPELPTFPDGLISNEKGEADLLKAIGQYDGETRCTAVFVRLSDNENAPAYVLTNGHCAQDWNPNAVNINKIVDHKVYFNVFKNTPDSARIEVAVKQIAYSTMKGTDLAVVELNSTVKQLMDQGIQPLPIARNVPAGYSDAIIVSKMIVDSLPKVAGQTTLAVIGGNTPTFDATWQQPKYATVVRVEIDKTAPTKEPIVSIRELDDFYVISLGFAPPELSDYIYKVGHPDSVSTTNTKDYNRYRRIPFEVPKGKLQKLVVIGFDVAGNATKPYVKNFP